MVEELTERQQFSIVVLERFVVCLVVLEDVVPQIEDDLANECLYGDSAVFGFCKEVA